MASRAKKTKLDSETLSFNDDWKLKYLFIAYYHLRLIQNQCVCCVTNVCRLWRNRIWNGILQNIEIL